MFSFIKNIFGSNEKKYQNQKSVLKDGSIENRKAVAEAKDTNPEILYYLAKDNNPAVRKAVAMNKATPVHASALLANDDDVDVRLALAARLVELLPGISSEKHSKLYAYAVQALGVLAQDEILNIRRALSTALKDYAKAPPKIVGQLARDIEREVAEPVLRFCLAVSDNDLLDILGEHPEPWVISTIAERPVVSDKVSDAVIETGDIPANKALIHNNGARLTKGLLQKIIEKSRDVPELQEDIVTRKDLSYDLAQKIAGFVSDSVLKILEDRKDFDKETSKEIAALVKRRMEFHSQSAPYETPESKVARYSKSGKLDSNIIQDALAWQDKDFVLLGMSKLAAIHPIIAEKMLGSGSAKSVLALCWKAKLPVRLAIILQRDYARLLPDEIIYAKGGDKYPLDMSEIKWQLEFYGVDLK